MIQRSSILLWSFVAVVTAVYVSCATHFVHSGLLGVDYFSLLFESDPSRVIENSTSFWGDQARTRVHPLHILVVAPFGLALEKALGSAEWAAVVITAAFAGGVIVNVAKVLERVGLTTLDRLLFVVLLAGSASHLVFGGPVPETHVMSAFFLSAAVRSLSPERLERLERGGHTLWTWFRDGGGVALSAAAGAVGMLLTHIVTMPVYGYLLLRGARDRKQRRWLSLVAAFGVAVAVLALHVGQRVVFPPVRGTAPTSLPTFLVKDPTTKDTIAHWKTEDSAGVMGKVDYVVHSLRSNLAWTTSLTSIPKRIPHVANTVLINSLFAPEFEVRHYSWRPAPLVTFEPWSSAHRLAGGVGAVAWLGLLGASMVASWGKMRRFFSAPALTFTAVTFVYNALLFTIYGDEIFLFSPNWVFALVILAGALYACALRTKPHWQPALRAALCVAAFGLVVNSILFFSELVWVY